MVRCAGVGDLLVEPFDRHLGCELRLGKGYCTVQRRLCILAGDRLLAELLDVQRRRFRRHRHCQ